jgi:hypothetical protein
MWFCGCTSSCVLEESGAAERLSKSDRPKASSFLRVTTWRSETVACGAEPDEARRGLGACVRREPARHCASVRSAPVPHARDTPRFGRRCHDVHVFFENHDVSVVHGHVRARIVRLASIGHAHASHGLPPTPRIPRPQKHHQPPPGGEISWHPRGAGSTPV